MSRIAILGLTLIAAPVVAFAESGDARFVTYREATSVEPRCTKPSRADEIVVCGNRRADRWRVPFLGYELGDPRGEGVSSERNRLASEPPVKCGIGAFLSNCGMVGVSVGTKFDGQPLRYRPLAK